VILTALADGLYSLTSIIETANVNLTALADNPTGVRFFSTQKGFPFMKFDIEDQFATIFRVFSPTTRVSAVSLITSLSTSFSDVSLGKGGQDQMLGNGIYKLDSSRVKIRCWETESTYMVLLPNGC
jgi:hypothetical protein